MKRVAHSTFAGERIEVFHYPPDYLVEINGNYFGFYTSPSAGEDAAQRHILEKNKDKK